MSHKVLFVLTVCKYSWKQLIANVMDMCLITNKCLYGYWAMHQLRMEIINFMQCVEEYYEFCRQIKIRNMLPTLQFTMCSSLLRSVQWNIVHVQWHKFDKFFISLFADKILELSWVYLKLFGLPHHFATEDLTLKRTID